MSFEDLANVEVVGSTLTSKDLSSVPSSVTVYGQDEIRRMGVDNLQELMNFVPGFQTYQTGDGPLVQTYSSRGRKSGTVGREILVLINGNRTEMLFSGGSAIPFSLYSLAHVRSVEFIRGPGSAVYGANAFLGVVNVVTDKNLNEVQVQVGTEGFVDTHLGTSGFYEGWKWSLNLRSLYDQGESYNLPNTFNNDVESTSDPREALDALLSLEYFDTLLEYRYFRRDTEEFYLLDNIDNSVNEYDTDGFHLSLKQEFELTDELTGNVRVGYRRNEEDLRSAIAPGVGLNYEAVYKEYHFSSFNNWQFAKQSSLQFGLDYRRLEFDSADTSFNNLPVALITDLAKQDLFGVFMQVDHQFNDEFEVFGGLRFDSLSSVDSSLSPRLGLIYHINENQDLKLLYGEAFRAPTFDELYTDAPVVVGNTDLDPETIKTIDLIWLGRFDRVHLHLGYFYSIISDAIFQEVSGFQRVYQNSDNEESFSGLELEIQYFWDENWSLRAGGSHFFNQAASSFRESEYLGFLALNYQERKFNVNLSANYAGSRERLDQGSSDLVELDGYWDINAKALYNFSVDWEFFIQAKNLLNHRFTSPAQGELENGVPNRGLELSVGAKWKF